jgi:hypothetical protein
MACVALQLVSVTRGALVGLAIVFATAVWLSSPTLMSFIRRSFKISVPSAILVAVAILMSTAFSPEVMERWQTRVFAAEEYGVDPTSISRLAEIKEQIDRWSESPTSVLFGKGYGAAYGWSKDLWDVMLDTQSFRLENVDNERTEFGHNYWVSSLFCGGLLFGLALPLMFIYATLYGLKMSKWMLRWRVGEITRLEVSRTTLILTAALATTIGGNPFTYRYSPLILGAALGAMVVTLRRFDEQQAVAHAYFQAEAATLR